jgi:AcrR family transcriptional regulator
MINDQAQSTSEIEKRATHAENGSAPSLPVTPRGEATRRRILDAAENVFGEVGYYKASISEITRRAGVAQGTFYIYFRSKHEIFVELVEDIGHRLRAQIRADIQDAQNRLEIERRGFATFFEFASTHRRIYSIVQEAERVAPEVAQAYYRAISQGYERGLRAAMEAGNIRKLDPEAIAYALMGIGHFVALRWIIWPQEGEEMQTQPPQLPEEVYTAVMDFIEHGLAKPDEPT